MIHFQHHYQTFLFDDSYIGKLNFKLELSTLYGLTFQLAYNIETATNRNLHNGDTSLKLEPLDNY